MELFLKALSQYATFIIYIFFLIIVGLLVCLMKALLRFSGFVVVKDATSL